MKKRKKTSKLTKKPNYLKIIIFIILALLIISIITMGIFSKKLKIIEIKTFSEIPGFSFEYPVFKDWEVKEIKKISEDKYSIIFNKPKGVEMETLPNLEIKKIPTPDQRYIEKFKNSQGIGYGELSGPDGYIFGSKEKQFIISITFMTSPLYEKGFSRDIFWNKIIDSFKFTNCSPESIGAVPFKKLTDKTFTQDIIYLEAAGAKVIERLKEDKENPDDFYVKFNENEYETADYGGYLITFHLSHKDDFKPENCNKPGNRSGKSRVMIYDTNQNKIISDLLWK